ncbi:MAG: hypothetical protein GF364_12810, partial [Candidatus Lokiarchaeota archaeon]|nr:hypothetical protein [Candidatus Lokiarchaeota archaeon]
MSKKPKKQDKNVDSNGIKSKRRRKRSSKTLINPEIILSSEFETGNGKDFKEYDTDIYGFYPERDPGELYSGQPFYFKFSVKNRLLRPTDIKKITVTAIADYDKIWKGWTSSLNIKLWKYLPNGIIQHLNPRRVKPTRQSIGINLKVSPQESYKISNLLVIPYSDMKDMLLNYHGANPNTTELTKIGVSALENEIYSLRILPKNQSQNYAEKPLILVSGTPQSNEFGDYAALNILSLYLDEGPKYWENLAESFRLEFIFFQNPDGIVEGKNMVNSEGENIFFGFKKHAEECPKECKKIWEHIEKDPPQLYLE